MGSLNILGIEGKKGAGKDAAFHMIKKMSPVDVKRFAFADRLKSELLTHFNVNKFILHGTTDQKDTMLCEEKWEDPEWAWCRNGRSGRMTYRELMQSYGALMGCEYWINGLMGDVQAYADQYPDDIMIVTDVRFPKEVGALLDVNATLVKVDGVSTELFIDDESETQELYYDYIVPGRGKAPISKTKSLLADIMWSSFGVACDRSVEC